MSNRGSQTLQSTFGTPTLTSVQKGTSLSYKFLSPACSLESEMHASPQQFLFTALSSGVGMYLRFDALIFLS